MGFYTIGKKRIEASPMISDVNYYRAFVRNRLAAATNTGYWTPPYVNPMNVQQRQAFPGI